MRAGDRLLRVLRPEMARDGVLGTPPRVLSTTFLLSTPVSRGPKLSVNEKITHLGFFADFGGSEFKEDRHEALRTS